MNKLLLTSICAVALSSAASAFTLDLSTLNNTVIGSHTLTQEGAVFTIEEGVVDAPATEAGEFTTGGTGDVSITVNQNSTVVINYDNTKVSYSGVYNPFGYTINDSGSALTLHTGSYANFEFDAVPEPSSTALLGLGGLALILRRRK
ncbi:MAG: PEP-CTERM sorting domain-containing protein [Akkermansiaceae bacterium]